VFVKTASDEKYYCSAARTTLHYLTFAPDEITDYPYGKHLVQALSAAGRGTNRLHEPRELSHLVGIVDDLAECADEVSLSQIEAVSLDSLRAEEREDGGSTASTYSQATPHPPQS